MKKMQRGPKRKDRKEHRQRVLWRRMAACLAVLVLMITGYALIFPAVTMEDQAGKVSGKEKEAEWEKTLPETLTGDWGKDLAAVAESQVGYDEKDEDNLTKEENTAGFTRYEIWYEEECEDWNGVFLAFCLHYAEIPENALSRDADVSTALCSAQDGGFYKEAGQYEPQEGDIAFLEEDRVGIVTEISEDDITVTEGDVDGAVVLVEKASPLGYADMETGRRLYEEMEKNQTDGNPEQTPPDIQDDEIFETEADAGMGETDGTVDGDDPAGQNIREDDPVDLKEYVMTRGFGVENPAFLEKLLDSSGKEIQKGQDGKYHIRRGETYKWSIELYAPAGLPEAGTYTYSMPDGIVIDQTADWPHDIQSDGETIGMLSASEDGTTVILQMQQNTKIRLWIRFEMNVSFPMSDPEMPVSPEIEFVTESKGTVDKSVEAAANGDLEWTITAYIPGYDGNTLHSWFLYDFVRYQGIHYPDLSQGAITITREGEEPVTLPTVEEAGPEDKAAFWWGENKTYGTNVLYLVSRMETHNENHNTLEGALPPGWCADWHETKNSVIEIAYTYKSIGEFEEEIENTVELRIDTSSTANPGTWADDGEAGYAPPDVLEKSKQDNSFIITFNDDMLDLTGHDEVVIYDEMNGHLLYKNGSIQITAENADGIVQLLTYGDDYKLEVDPDLTRLSVTILEPGAYRYKITYDVAINTDSPTTGTQVLNKAEVEIFDQKYAADATGTLSDFDARAEEYQLSIRKTDVDDSDLPVVGAVYGLYSWNGELLQTRKTGQDGAALFQGAPALGIILASNQLYYIQEIEAPEPYLLSEIRYWFYYEGSDQKTIQMYMQNAQMAGFYDGQSVPTVIPDKGFPQSGSTTGIPVADERWYELPETGGPGNIPYTIAGLLLAGGAGTALYRKMSKEGRKEGIKMRRMKKILGLFLAAAMLLAMNATVFANDDNTVYTITIENTATGHTYQAYQVFSGDLSTNEDGDKVLSNIEWGKGVNGDKILEEIKTAGAVFENAFADCENAADAAKILEGKGDDFMKAFADIVGQNLTSEVAGTSSGTDNYTIQVTGAGYYLIKDKDASLSGTDAYTDFILKVTDDQSVAAKSAVPSVEKKVLEDDKYTENGGYGEGYNDAADWNIGEDISFRLIGSLPSNYEDYTTYSYTFHDTLSAGLTLDEESIDVYAAEDREGTNRKEITAEYSVNTPGTEADGSKCSFEVAFSNLKSDTNLDAGDYIIVDYTAQLNENAVIGGDGNINKVFLEFSNNPNSGGEGDRGETPEDTAIVFTYELNMVKVDGEDQTVKLEGAEFKLYREVGGTKQYVVLNNGKVTGWTETEDDGSVLTSGEDGTFRVSGLDDGVYTLVETKAPDGYNDLKAPIEITLTADTDNGQNWDGVPGTALEGLTITVGETEDNVTVEDGTGKIMIANYSGSILPGTGGMGTTVFYVLGGILVVGAGAVLIIRKLR